MDALRQAVLDAIEAARKGRYAAAQAGEGSAGLLGAAGDKAKTDDEQEKADGQRRRHRKKAQCYQQQSAADKAETAKSDPQAPSSARPGSKN
jgi:hypothetical protein